MGETFSGVDYDDGVAAAREFAAAAHEAAPDLTPAQVALAWIVQREGVSTVIPGARNAEQAQANARAGDAPALGEVFERQVADIYDRYFRAAVHPRW